MLKRNWKEIDDHAAKAKVSDGDTYDKLVTYLDKDIKKSPDRDLHMTRGLLQWLKRIAYQTGDFSKDSPNGLARRMFKQEIAFADGYKKLCDHVNVKCEVVVGVSKTGQYKPGDTVIEREKMQARWNKVFLLGKWWPIYPRWVLRSVSRSDNLGASGTGASDAEIVFNDFWFLTDPELFIHKCYPDNIEDQMLPIAKQIKKERQFMKLPYLTPAFHDNSLRMTSEDLCMVEAIDGVCRISFKADRNTGKNFVCEFKKKDLKITDLKDNDCTKIQQAIKDIDISKLVFCSRKKNHFMFDIRCPIEGAYHLSMRGGTIGDASFKILTKAKIICREKMEDFQPFPTDPENIGWGFGPIAYKAGLVKTDKKEPKLLVEPKGGAFDLSIKFALDKDAGKTSEFQAELSGNGKTADDLKAFVKATKSVKSLTVEVKSPEAGEYALTILASNTKGGPFTPVCYYMLTTLEEVEKIEDEYYDSSDGTSDIDEEIEQLDRELTDLTAERDRLKELVKSRQNLRLEF